MQAIQAYMGHADLMTTQRCAKWAPDPSVSRDLVPRAFATALDITPGLRTASRGLAVRHGYEPIEDVRISVPVAVGLGKTMAIPVAQLFGYTEHVTELSCPSRSSASSRRSTQSTRRSARPTPPTSVSTSTSRRRVKRQARSTTPRRPPFRSCGTRSRRSPATESAASSGNTRRHAARTTHRPADGRDRQARSPSPSHPGHHPDDRAGIVSARMPDGTSELSRRVRRARTGEG